MLTIKELTVKNFMSVGNATQSINFANKNLVLVIGENLDLGGDDAGARNGTGKTTIINALSYVFYGEALTNIRRDNLVNKTNEKGMLVSVKKDHFFKEGLMSISLNPLAIRVIAFLIAFTCVFVSDNVFWVS